jgi:hypothetical protein
MTKAIAVKQKKRKPGRPETGHEFLGVRLAAGTIAKIDAWATAKSVSRSEAVRLLIERGLKR